MQYLKYLLIFIFCWIEVSSQVNEQFTDGDFTSNPVWAPSAPADFVIANGQLQSNNTVASSSFYISTPSTTSSNAQWEFFVNLKFATSSTNYVDAYLMADNSNLLSPTLNGYFVRIGNTNDDISLYKMVSGVASILIDGVNTSVASSSNNLIKIKVTRNLANQFTLDRDMTGTGNSFVSEGSITDATFTSSTHFGFLIKQSTASFFQKHFFDDIYVGPIIVDQTPPSITQINIISSTQLDVLFNENLDATTAQNSSNYLVSNGVGTAQSANLDAQNSKLVHLTFTNSFVNGLQHTLTINNVQDAFGNACSNLIGTFTYLVFAAPNYKDIILTEIMVDVNPIPSGLPAKQYIELYNKSSNYFNLIGLQFSDGVSTASVTNNYTFGPGSYVMICKSSDTALFTGITNKIGTVSFPTFNTTGDPVFIYDGNGSVLDSIRYTQAWYRDAVKDDGGWSLELINPTQNANCPAQNNWIASNANAGGTPGTQNSVYSLAPDLTAPNFLSATVLDSVTLELCFNEAIDVSQISNTTNYSLNNGTGNPTQAIASSNNQCVTLKFSTPFISQQNYIVTFSTLSDCSGNLVTPGNANFTYIQISSPNYKDIILTEIMVDVNPVPAGLPAKQYIELYNKSSNYFNLNGLQFSDGVSTASVTNNYTFAPGTYVMICKSTDTSLFTVITNKIGTSSFPTFNTTGDPVFIYDGNGSVLDSIRYTQAWYRDAVKDDGGWSLELINPTLNVNCPPQNNWIASNATAGGTPGTQNSVYSLAPDLSSPNVVSVTAFDSVTLELCFNEAIDASQISNTTNYSVNNGIGNPSQAIASSNNQCVTLKFATPFVSQQNYILTFSTLSDCSGNLVTPGNANFTYIQISSPNYKDIILTEIMVDVNPIPSGLPAKQYIELYNKSSNYFNLNGLQFSDGVSTASVTNNYTFAPGSYVMICKTIDTALFTGITNKIGTSSFPTFNTTGDPVFIYDGNGSVLDSIRYTQAWYGDAVKDDGGWSLELINPTLNINCPAQNNWIASNATTGGTPGTQNSVYSLAPDLTAPNFVSANALDSITVELCFDEAIDASQINILTNYFVNNGIGNPSQAIASSNNQCVTLKFSSPFLSQQTNMISFSFLTDCSGNLVNPGLVNFIYIQTSSASFNDVIVNEIMVDVNPRPAGLPAIQYLELYNKSSKTFNLNNWQISDRSSSGIINSNYLLLPNSYVVIVKQIVIDSFAFLSNKIGITTYPTYNTTGDGVYIQDNTGNFIDSLNYDDAWYNNSVKDDGGWSLELINPLLNASCEVSGNWTASNATSGGTPGTQNSVYSVNPDIVGPSLLYVSVSDSLHISVCFNEGLLNASSLQLTNYTVNNSIGQPTSLVSNGNCFDLTLSNPLQNEQNYTLNFSNLSDCSGNPLTSNSINFSYYRAKPYDVVINELFPDPEPQVALPQGEYVELYNKTNYAITLKNWTLTVGTNDILIPDAVILPDSFLVLIDNTSLNSFINEGYGNIPLLVLDAMSSSELNATGENVILKDQNGNLISYVQYDDAWYQDDAKKAGGWSLEQIDPRNPCAGSTNWMASVNANGGTPGRRNSVNANRADLSLPQILRVNIKNKDTIVVVFSESMLQGSLLSTSNYTINNGIGQPTTVTPLPYAFRQVQLSLPVSLQKNSTYQLTINGNLQDCAGNNIATQTSITFGMPDTLLPGDLLINEVLFAPKTGCVDYLELYNNSSKIIDLKSILIGEGLVNSTLISDTVEVTNDGYIMFPGQYVLLASNPDAVKSCYTTKHPEWFFEMKKLPTMNTSEDVVVLCNRNGVLIDKLEYSDDMHFDLLNDFKGVSLERIDFNRPTLDKTNWNSAAANVGFGTPGYQNSQFMQTKGEGTFSVVPEIFSPDNDGYNDVLTFNYELNEPGLAGNLSIYNANGQLIRYLVRNENLATKGSYSWNGLTDQNEKAPIGIYVIYFETFNKNGDVQKHKFSCVLAGKL